MGVRQIGIGVVGAIVLIAMVLAGATIWLFLSNPVTVANAINEGEFSPFIRDLARVILVALQGLLKYL